ncbi:MAG: leucine-rich repeat protein, partial [Bacilli bacterium]|nr:leucine-rich repeat protein [Bacilli bacterium]
MRYKLIKFLVFCVLIGVILINFNTICMKVYGVNDFEAENDYTIDDIRDILSSQDIENEYDEYLTVFNEDGLMQDIIIDNDEDEDEDVDVVCTNENALMNVSNPFNVRKIVDSGRPDSESIVITIMGDGFTETEQDEFIDAAQSSAIRLINEYPMRLYKNYFSVYAVEVISNESGVSRDVDDFNWGDNNHEVDNYFGSRFWHNATIFNKGSERILYITKKARVRALEHEDSVLTIILCNSMRRGGSAKDFAVSSLYGDYERIVSHEFGHAFANLADEYFFRPREAVNMTKINNPSTVKWSNWIDNNATGIYKIGVYPYGTSGMASNWYRPHESCKMNNSNRDFCAVCSSEIIRLLEQKTGDAIETVDLSDGNICISNFNIEYSGKLSIPIKLNGKYVTMLGDSSFENYDSITSISMLGKITDIGSNSFKDCINLSRVNLNRELINIHSNAFKNCKNLDEITIPDNVMHIGNNVFDGCSNLTNIILPNSLVEIGQNAFKDCESLSEIEIPNSVISIGNGIFEGCSGLSKLKIPYLNSYVGKLYGFDHYNVPASRMINLSEVIIDMEANISNDTFYGCDLLESVGLPKEFTLSGDDLFHGCDALENIYYNGTLEDWCILEFNSGTSNPMYYAEKLYMKNNSSQYYQIEEIEIPDSIINIGDYVFYGCKNLINITISDSVETIGNSAFEGCINLKDIVIPSDVTSIGSSTFSGCSSLANVEFKKDTYPITIVGINVFYLCNPLLKIKVPSSKIIQYKNLANLSSYSDIIIPNESLEVMYVNCYSDILEDEELQSRK